MTRERTFKARVDHPEIVAIVRNCANVEACMDGMSDGDKFHVISIIANRLGRQMYIDCEQVIKQDGIDSIPDKLRTFMTVIDLLHAAESMQTSVQILDFGANPDRYQVTSEEGH